MARFVFAASLALAASALWRLVPRWQAWRAGAPEAFADPHYAPVLSAVMSLLLALVVPIPLLLLRAEGKPRWWRRALWSTWAALIAASLTVFVLHART